MEKTRCIVCGNILPYRKVKYCSKKCGKIGVKKKYKSWLKEQPEQEYKYEDEFDSVNYFESIDKFKEEQFYKSLETKTHYNGVCPRCTKRDAVSEHHIIPRDRGGGNNKENMIYLCFKCHDEVEILTDEALKIRNYSTLTLRSFITNGTFPTK